MAYKGIHNFTVQEALNIELGQGGTELCATGATCDTATYIKIQSLHTATTVTATGSTTQWSDLSAVPLEAGEYITGSYSSVTIGGGSASALLYKG
jgi:diaminopimelate epimerase